MVLTWYNPYQSKLYKRTLPEVTIDVQPNPDLGLLESIRDSLRVEQELAQEQGQEQEAGMILGMSYQRFVAVMGLIMLGLLLIFTFGRLLLIKYREAQQAYRGSEKYYFDQFTSAAKSNSSSAANKLYRWIDELNLENPTIEHFVGLYGSSQLKDHIATNSEVAKIPVKEWTDARNRMIQLSNTSMATNDTHWINP